MTIRDLARKLNLSITTVSRALDGYDDVAEGTRQKVIQAANEIGYEPSFAARQLRRRRSDTIGYILPTDSPRFSDPFYADFLTGLCDAASQQEFDLLISSTSPESEAEKSLYRHWMLSHRVDGVVLNRIRHEDWRIIFLKEHNIPFVALGVESPTPDYPAIQVKEKEGFQDLVRYLYHKGHRRIAFIGASPKLLLQTERFQGYQTGLEMCSIPLDTALIQEGDLTEHGGYLCAQRLLQLPSPPTAILGCNDLTALGVMEAIQNAGLHVGKDIAVAGYDGIKEGEHSNPSLTTLCQPTYEIAGTLIQMLINCLNGAGNNGFHVAIEPRLILRESTG